MNCYGLDYCIGPCHSPAPTAPAALVPVSPVHEVFKKYAAEIDKMYDNRTRGDYSAIGILSEFARALKEAESQ